VKMRKQATREKVLLWMKRAQVRRKGLNKGERGDSADRSKGGTSQHTEVGNIVGIANQGFRRARWIPL